MGRRRRGVASLRRVMLDDRWWELLRLGGALSSPSFLPLSTLPLPGLGVAAWLQARSFGRFFSFFASLVEASVQDPPRRDIPRGEGLPFSLSFFFSRSPGRTRRVWTSP